MTHKSMSKSLAMSDPTSAYLQFKGIKLARKDFAFSLIYLK